ncbi:hypothetical protein F4777DRAFT_554408 [Nemania sp. FL0916]|nr:hypothetical protein F4777DRAFT_554408 [Nemania sp. FL0916]
MADLSLGKIQAALASATNEVTVAAANINFDFTLMKFEAPPEYQPVSNSLTSKRRESAEHGDIHVTARRLTALFEGVCPSTPDLIKAYGRRASEISESAKKMPSKVKGGMFAEYLGIDATSIWAAATSSQSGNAIQIHLLACLLARMWTHAEAVSIWDQIVTSRRHEIAEKLKDNGSVSFSALAAATQQEVSLGSLANWDTSARSWLRTADSVKSIQQTQFQLIWKNLSLPVNNETGLYRSVMDAWSSAAQVLNRVIGGAPHVVNDGAVLLAMSSWHIYPDLLVYGVDVAQKSTTEVLMNDDLIAEGGTLSLGLSKPGKAYTSVPETENTGVKWSVPLDRLKNYGKSVRRTRTLLDDGHRLSFQDLLSVNLGVILTKWRVARGDRDCYIALIIKMISFLKLSGQVTPTSNFYEPNWMNMLLEPALYHTQLPEKSNFLLDLGSRRKIFVEESESDDGEFTFSRGPDWPHLFNLCRVDVLQSILIGEAANVNFLLHVYHRHFQNIPDALIAGFSKGRDVQATVSSFWTTKSLSLYPPGSNQTIETQCWSPPPSFHDHLPNDFKHGDDVKYHILMGDPRFAAIYVRSSVIHRDPTLQNWLSRPWDPDEILWCLESSLVSQERLRKRFEPFINFHCGRHLCFLRAISHLYSSEWMEGSTISSRVLDRPLLRPWKKRRPFYPVTRTPRETEEPHHFISYYFITLFDV